jgi:threonine aldolase
MAAAGLVALDRLERLAEDHERARRLAAGLRERGWHASTPETNIVLVAVADLGGALERLEDRRRAGQLDVRAGPAGHHADLSDADITAALDRIGPVETGGSSGVPEPRARLRRTVGHAPVRPTGR